MTDTLALQKSPADESLYTGFTNDMAVLTALYVDELLVAFSCLVGLWSIKSAPGKAFEMRDLNETRQCSVFEIV